MNRTLSGVILILMVSGTTQAAAVCSLASTGVAFGSYNTLSSRETDTAGTIAVTCMGVIGETVHYTIAIGPGSGAFSLRQMGSGDRGLHYNLFIDPNRSLVWGDGTSGTGVVSDTLVLTVPSVTKNHVVYSRIPRGQKQLAAQGYTDNLMVTLSY